MRTPNATASPRSGTAHLAVPVGAVMAALDTVIDPELEEPITDLGFVRSVTVDDAGVAVHLRLPATHRSPNVPYLIASDALDALRDIDDLGDVRVMLDDHHDSERTFLLNAHTAAMQRCVTALLRDRTLDDTALQRLTLRDLPDNKEKWALVRRRVDIGLSGCPNSRVVVDEDGRPHITNTGTRDLYPAILVG